MKFRFDTRSVHFARIGAVAGAAMLLCMSVSAQTQARSMKPYWEFKKPKMIKIEGDLSYDTNGAQPPVRNNGSPYVLGFEGVTQYDGAAFGRNFIPPDTMGAVGASQYMQTSNGAYAVFDKYTGTRLSLTSDVAFWAAAGQTGANGDSRVMYNASANRWVAVSFGADVKDLQIAVSDTSNALGSWQSVKFEGYGGVGAGGAVADYPTLALDRNAVYIGTNNFAPSTPGGSASFRGTTLNVIPLNSLFGAGAPTISNMKQFVTPYPGGADNGFALQGVNSRSAGTTGKVVAASLFNYDNVAYKVNGLNPNDATGSTTTASQSLGMAAYSSPQPGRQPSVAIPANRRVIDTLDERISSSVYEANGRIYMVNTVDDTADGQDFARVRYTVVDADTFQVLDQGNIGTGDFDYYQGSIAVNSFGQVAIGYNRSGLQTTDLNSDGLMDGNVSFMGRTFETDASGKLVASSDELLLKVSLTDDYHNGSLYGQPAAGRQRWGDYSQVSIDPENEHNFYMIGQFAREYNLPEFGHPNGTGGSRWGTWVAMITTPVPEPGTWAMMVLGLGVVGALAARRRRAQSENA